MRTHRGSSEVLLALACCMAAAESGAAQVELPGAGAAWIAAGASSITTGDLDDWLTTRGYPSFGSTAVVVGIGGYRAFRSGLMLGVEAQGLVIGDDTHEDTHMGLGGGYATVGVGYAFQPSPRVRVYPRLGAGPGGMALWSEREDTLDFRDVLDDQVPPPERDPNLSRDGLVLDLGGGVELLPRGPAGLLIGLRAGYLAGPFTSGWETYGHPVSGGPDASIAGPYARLLVGWAWGRRVGR